MTMTPTLRIFLGIASVASVVVAGARIVDSYQGENFYCHDFIQEYVLARAVLDGKDPYVPIPDLVSDYFPERPNLPWSFPTPHPPPTALFSIPLALVDYRTGLLVWLALELACLANAVGLLARWWGEPVSFAAQVVLFCLCLSLGPVIHDLWLGQFSLILLNLFLYAWLALRRGRDWLGGAILGLSISLKLAGWLLVLFLLLRGRWRAALAAGAVVLALHAAAILVMGWPSVRAYYSVVGPEVARHNKYHLQNFSLWTIGGRCFTPMPAPVAFARVVFVTPLFSNPALEPPVNAAVLGVVVIGALVLAWRCRSFDSAFGILVCAGMPLNPVVWDHYLCLAAIPLAVLARRFKDGIGSRGPMLMALIGLAFAIVPHAGAVDLAIHQFGVLDRDVMHVSFWAGLTTYVPLISLGAWIWSLWQTDRLKPSHARYETIGYESVPHFPPIN
jgi:hypothetical protein